MCNHYPRVNYDNLRLLEVVNHEYFRKEFNRMPIAKKNTYLTSLTTVLSKTWPDNRTVNLVFHGHSVPCGYFGFHVVNTFDAYPHLVHVKLKERFPMAVINTIRTGVGGENSESGAARFERDVLCHKPDLVAIDYALNDISLGLEKTNTAWCSMVEAALSRDIKVILLTPSGRLPNVSGNDLADQLRQHAEKIRRIADTYNVGLADSFAAFETYCRDEGELSDLLSWVNHPNRKGHEIIAREILRNFTVPTPE